MAVLADIKNLFKTWSADESGFIERDALYAVFKLLDSNVSDKEKEFHKMIDECATGPDGSIFIDLFLDKLWSDVRPVGSAADMPNPSDSHSERLKAAFVSIDSDGDGLISILEFTKLLRQQNTSTIPYKVVNKFFKKADVDANSKLDFGEFCILTEALMSGSVEGLPAVDVVELAQKLPKPVVSASPKQGGSVKLHSPRLGAIELTLNVEGPSVIDSQELGNCFTKIDKDKDGFISILEFTKFLRFAKDNMIPYKLVNGLFGKADSNKDTKLDFSEFSKLAHVLQSGSVSGIPAIDLVEISKRSN